MLDCFEMSISDFVKCNCINSTRKGNFICIIEGNELII